MHVSSTKAAFTEDNVLCCTVGEHKLKTHNDNTTYEDKYLLVTKGFIIVQTTYFSHAMPPSEGRETEVW